MSPAIRAVLLMSALAAGTAASAADHQVVSKPTSLGKVSPRTFTFDGIPHKRLVRRPGVVDDKLCYTARSYRYAREERGSDATVPVGYTTCTPGKKFELKSADISDR